MSMDELGIGAGSPDLFPEKSVTVTDEDITLMLAEKVMQWGTDIILRNLYDWRPLESWDDVMSMEEQIPEEA